ncbi:MAG: DUF4115 domain-containing protein [Sulfuricellaceae bacterium]|nr:DUF4115 domain-containing protein [Sulfuricellaceae bacterium]
MNEVARQLKLSVRQIEALEADDYGSLPGPTFVRGFVRNYAKILRIDPAPVLSAYQNTDPQQPVQVISAPDNQVAFSEGPRSFPYKWAFGLVVGVTLAAAGWGLYNLPSREPMIAAKVKVPALPPAVKRAAQVPAAAPAHEAEPASAALPAPEAPHALQATEGSLVPSALPPPAVPLVNAEKGKAILLEFSGMSWVEVRDRNNQILFSQLGQAGNSQSVQGTPPFEVVIGKASVVKLSYNGKPVDLAPYTRVEVARLKLD